MYPGSRSLVGSSVSGIHEGDDDGLDVAMDITDVVVSVELDCLEMTGAEDGMADGFTVVLSV